MHESEPIVESARSPRPLVAPFSSRPPVDSRSGRPLREGLPPGFRMRADAHYVDQLDARVATLPVRLIDVSTLEAADDGETLSPAFVGSIRRFGVLQPLLVTERDGRYHVIAGRRRAAAARLLGLPDVPCIVHHVEDAAADEMTAASNLPGAAPATQREPVPEAPTLTADLTQVLTALVSCAELLTSPSTLTPAAASALVRAEALRALDTLIAARVLRDEMPAAPAK